MLEYLQGISTWVWTLIIFAVFLVYYIFRNIRAYNKNRDAILGFQNKLEVGSRVILNSGVHGTIKEINKRVAIVQIAPKVDITVERFSISTFEKAEVKEEVKEEKTTE